MSGDGLRAIALVASLVAVPGCSRLTGPSPVDGPWRVVETTHFALHVRPGSFAEQHVATFGDVLEDQRTVSLDRLGLRSEGRLLGFFYDFAGEGGLESSREGVAYPLTQSFKLVASPPLDANLFVLMSHEANHVITREVLGRPGTSFVNEGLASALLSERYHQMGPSFLHRWCAETSGLPPVADLIDDDKWSGLDYERKYNASASFLAFLLERYGPDPLRLIYGASSSRLRDRFGEAYGIGLDQAEAEWQEFLRQQ